MIPIARRRRCPETMKNKWLAAEEEIPDPMAGPRPPHVPESPVPVFAAGDLRGLERTCTGRSFQQRRDAAVIAVFAATGIRLSELAASGMTRMTHGAPTSTFGAGRSPSTARTARPGPSRSATTRPVPSTGTSGSASGTPRPAARHPAVILIEGEAGIGKTRLLDEALADARLGDAGGSGPGGGAGADPAVRPDGRHVRVCPGFAGSAAGGYRGPAGDRERWGAGPNHGDQRPGAAVPCGGCGPAAA